MKVARIYLRVMSFSEDDCTEYQKSAARPSPMPIRQAAHESKIAGQCRRAKQLMLCVASRMIAI